MGAMKRQLHLNLFIHGRGHHEAAWRHPGSSPLALTDIRYYQDLACRAEAALLSGDRAAQYAALPAGLAGTGPGRVVRHRLPLRAAAGCQTHRDFVPWRFSDAGRISACWIVIAGVRKPYMRGTWSRTFPCRLF